MTPRPHIFIVREEAGPHKGTGALLVPRPLNKPLEGRRAQDSPWAPRPPSNPYLPVQQAARPQQSKKIQAGRPRGSADKNGAQCWAHRDAPVLSISSQLATASTACSTQVDAVRSYPPSTPRAWASPVPPSILLPGSLQSRPVRYIRRAEPVAQTRPELGTAALYEAARGGAKAAP